MCKQAAQIPEHIRRPILTQMRSIQQYSNMLINTLDPDMTPNKMPPTGELPSGKDAA